MRMTDMVRRAPENRLFVEPSGWATPFQAWRERATSTRELAARTTNERAKKVLLMIAETYERLACRQQNC